MQQLIKEKEKEVKNVKKVSPEQALAIDAMEQFLKHSKEHYFLLEGFAGTGKTFCITELMARSKSRLLFTAPTNKATKVIRETLREAGYTPECRTIYSALGLMMSNDGEVKELKIPEDPIDLSSYAGIVVDEGSMVSEQLKSFIKIAAEKYNCKFIFLGDSAQLPPVKELISPIFTQIKEKSKLVTIMRYDNAILKLATAIRDKVNHPSPSIKFESDNDGAEGVWALSRADYVNKILAYADMGDFANGTAKVIAWRNVTVNGFNKMIRERIFPQENLPDWVVGDRLILTEPARDLEDNPIAHTDDEGVVTNVTEEFHPTETDIKVWRISVTLDDNRIVRLFALHPRSLATYNDRVEELSVNAKLDRRKWKDFWEFKAKFHSVRHAYAVTAHRAQGSTYETVFVDWHDILVNRNRQESFRCLYVACTRASKNLLLG